NGSWTMQRAEGLARKIAQSKPSSDSETVERAWRAVYGRSPSSREMEQAVGFLKSKDAPRSPRGEKPQVFAAENRRLEPMAQSLMKEMGLAAMFRPRSKQEKLNVPFDVSLPAGDFT